MEYKKVNHIEVSEGDTIIVSSSSCPLSEEESAYMQNTVYIEEENANIPVCISNAYLNINSINVGCSHFFGCTFSDVNGFQVDCRHIDTEERNNENH